MPPLCAISAHLRYTRIKKNVLLTIPMSSWTKERKFEWLSHIESKIWLSSVVGYKELFINKLFPPLNGPCLITSVQVCMWCLHWPGVAPVTSDDCTAPRPGLCLTAGSSLQSSVSPPRPSPGRAWPPHASPHSACPDTPLPTPSPAPPWHICGKTEIRR